MLTHTYVRGTVEIRIKVNDLVAAHAATEASLLHSALRHPLGPRSKYQVAHNITSSACFDYYRALTAIEPRATRDRLLSRRRERGELGFFLLPRSVQKFVFEFGTFFSHGTVVAEGKRGKKRQKIARGYGMIVCQV